MKYHTPPDVTLFAAQHLMVVDVLLAGAVLTCLLYHRHHANVVCWTFYSALLVSLSLIFFRIADRLYVDPRPFVVGHYHPLLAHTANNGFPSGYALIAAVIVSAVLFVSRLWSIPFVILAIAVDWARVGVGIHHVIDIVASWVLVGAASAIAIMVAPVFAAILLPRIPPAWTGEQLRIPVKSNT